MLTAFRLLLWGSAVLAGLATFDPNRAGSPAGPICFGVAIGSLAVVESIAGVRTPGPGGPGAGGPPGAAGPGSRTSR